MIVWISSCVTKINKNKIKIVSKVTKTTLHKKRKKKETKKNKTKKMERKKRKERIREKEYQTFSRDTPRQRTWIKWAVDSHGHPTHVQHCITLVTPRIERDSQAKQYGKRGKVCSNWTGEKTVFKPLIMTKLLYTTDPFEVSQKERKRKKEKRSLWFLFISKLSANLVVNKKLSQCIRKISEYVIEI